MICLQQGLTLRLPTLFADDQVEPMIGAFDVADSRVQEAYLGTVPA